MFKRLLPLMLFLLLFPVALYAEDTPTPSEEVALTRSTFTVYSQNAVDPYESFDVGIQFATNSGQSLKNAPTGKLYLWATDSNGVISPALDVVPISIPAGVYIHQTERQGVLIMDARALQKPQQFNLKLTIAGTYDLHALYIANGTIAPANVDDYWPFELTGAGNKRIVVNPTPARDIGMMVVSTRIHGIGVGSFVVTDPRDKVIQDQAIEVDATGAAPSDIQLTMLRRNGLSVGAGVPVYASSSNKNLRLSQMPLYTDADGVVHLSLQGVVGAKDILYVREGTTEKAVTIPLKSYQYKPEKVRFKIGSRTMNVDGRTVNIDTAAMIRNNRTYVPYRAIGELLGARIEYNDKIRTITTYFGNSTLTMSVGYNHYAVDGKVYQMDATPFINADGRTMVPLRFIGEVIGYDVQAITNSKKLTESVLFTRK